MGGTPGGNRTHDLPSLRQSPLPLRHSMTGLNPRRGAERPKKYRKVKLLCNLCLLLFGTHVMTQALRLC